jgi:hypothetical protein
LKAPEAHATLETSDHLTRLERAGRVRIGFHLERSVTDRKTLLQLSAEINQE